MRWHGRARRRPRHHERSRISRSGPRLRARSVARVPRPRATAGRALKAGLPSAADAARPRPRPRVRSARRRRARRDRPLFHRREDRALPHHACSRTTGISFRRYDAVLLYRADAPQAIPARLSPRGRGSKAGSTTPRWCGSMPRRRSTRCPSRRSRREYLGGEKGARRRSFWSALFAPDFGRLLASTCTGVRLARRRDPGRRAARHDRGEAAPAGAARAPCHRPDPDRPFARAARVLDPADRNHRRVARAHRPVPVRAAAHHAQRSRRARPGAEGIGPIRHCAWPDASPDPAGT